MSKINLITATPAEFARVLYEAAMLGARDVVDGTPERTGRQIVDLLAFQWRNGHVPSIKRAYMGGRFHAETREV